MDSYLPTGFAQIFETATKTLQTEARVKAVLAAYDKALAENVQMPSYLHCVLESLRNV